MVATLNEAYLDLRTAFKRAGVDNYRVEARELVCFAAGVSREELEHNGGRYLFDADLQRLRGLAERRLQGEPLPYLIGEWDFYGLTFQLTTDTLVPRADTELLCELGIAHLRGRERGRLLDLCCGSGCIGVAALANLGSGISGVFGDNSAEALRVTRQNILRHGVSARALTIKLDALQEPPHSLGKFHVILCNPPYIPTADIDGLSREVQHEPRTALDGGADGLDFYRAIIPGYKALLQKGGRLMLEIGIGQAADVQALLKASGYTDITVHKDLGGIERVVCAGLPE